jgi:hypothetical protein
MREVGLEIILRGARAQSIVSGGDPRFSNERTARRSLSVAAALRIVARQASRKAYAAPSAAIECAQGLRGGGAKRELHTRSERIGCQPGGREPTGKGVGGHARDQALRSEWKASRDHRRRPNYLAIVRDALDRIAVGTDRLLQRRTSSVLALLAWDLLNGRLVLPVAISLALEKTYWVVYPKVSTSEPKVSTFRDWLLAEAAEDARRLSALATKRKMS